MCRGQSLPAAGNYQIVPVQAPESCVDVAGPSKTPGAATQLYGCGDPVYATNQVWQVVPMVSSTGVAAAQLVSVYSGECLDVNGVSIENGAHLQQYTCGSASSLNQLWTFTGYGNAYQIMSVNSGACLDLPGGSSSNGNPLQQWTCSGGANPNQLWQLIAVSANTPPVQPPPPAGGLPAQFFGLTQIVSSKVPAIPVAAVRTLDSYPSLNWSSLNPSRGVYKFGVLDTFVNTNLARGADVLYVFNSTPDWASSNVDGRTANGMGHCAPPADMADWDAFLTALAAHVSGRVHLWEVWNEPQYYYCGSMSALVTMAQHANTILKAADSAALITSPAGTTVGGPQMLQSFLSAGGGNSVDVIAFHGYGHGADESVIGVVQGYKKVAAAYGQSSKPLWDTEAGWASMTSYATAAGRAGFIAKSYLLQASQGVSRFYWYGYDTTSYWGALTKSGALLPEGVAYREVRKWMVGATLTTACAPVTGGLWSCTLTRPGGYSALAVWNPNGPAAYTVPASYTQYHLLDGSVQQVLPGTGITLTNQPLLLETGSAF